MQFAKAGWIGLMAAAGLFGSLTAKANLVTNGGFEAGNFDGWSAPSSIYVGVDGLTPQEGAFAAFLATPDTSTISQTLTTTAGRSYSVSFFLSNDADIFGNATPNSFQFDWGGAQAMQLIDADSFAYTRYDFVLTASADQTDLSFTFYQGPGFWNLDAVEVAELSVDNSVPEPGSFALAGLAAALGLAASRRRAA